MGRYSFLGYSVCEIENDDSLEVIGIGELDKQINNSYWSDSALKSCYFYGSDCALRSCCDGMKWWIDLPKLKSLLFGAGAFEVCSRVAFESDSTGKRLMNRLAWIDFHSTWWTCILVQRWWWIEWTDNAKWWWWKEVMNRLAQTHYTYNWGRRKRILVLGAQHHSWKWFFLVINYKQTCPLSPLCVFPWPLRIRVLYPTKVELMDESDD